MPNGLKLIKLVDLWLVVSSLDQRTLICVGIDWVEFL